MFIKQNYKAYNTLCPANCYYANLILNKGDIKFHKKNGREKKYNSIQKETPYMKFRLRDFDILL